MAGFTDLLGTILQQGMAPSSGSRMGNALGGGPAGDSLEGLMGKLAKQMGATQSAPDPVKQSRGATPAPASAERPAPGGIDLGGMLGDLLGGLANNKSAMGGIGALIGALAGGGQQAAKGAVGGGGLAMLASLAMSALQSSGQAPAQTPRALMERSTDDGYEQELEDDAEIIVRAMINAAKADGRVGEAEVQRIIGKLQEDGLSQQEKAFFVSEANKPVDLSGVVASAGNRAEMAAQIYAASLLAIEVDTAAEQNYMKQLATGLGLHPEVVLHIERTLGI